MKTLEVRLVLVDDDGPGIGAGLKGKEIVFREVAAIPIGKGLSGTAVAKITGRVYERMAPFLKPAVKLADTGGDALPFAGQPQDLSRVNADLPPAGLVPAMQRDNIGRGADWSP